MDIQNAIEQLTKLRDAGHKTVRLESEVSGDQCDLSFFVDYLLCADFDETHTKDGTPIVLVSFVR